MMRARDERGFTLIEVLLVCVLGMIVFSATVGAFTSFYGEDRDATAQRDNVSEAQVAVGVVTRQLRNLANPTAHVSLASVPSTIYRASGNDFIFQTSDPAKTWVRYCLDTTSSGASQQHAKLWTAESPSTPSSPGVPSGMTGACPGSGAGITTRVVTQNISNLTGGQDRPVFNYACMSGQPVSCPASDADDPKITMVGISLFVDANPKDRIHEMQVSSAVYLRNQNQAPTAVVTGPVKVSSYKFMFNGSGSSDPEGRSLSFHWYLDTVPSSLTTAFQPTTFSCDTPGQDVWTGPTYTNDFTSANNGKQYQVWLAVCDPGGLYDVKGPFPLTVTP